MSGISPRQQVALNLADTCIFGGLNDAYGVSCEKSTDARGKTYWSVLFCKTRILDGVIRVYSPNFIVIIWQKGKEVFRSEADAKKFLVNTFIKE